MLYKVNSFASINLILDFLFTDVQVTSVLEEAVQPSLNDCHQKPASVFRYRLKRN